MPDDAARLYDEDFYRWTQVQAARLRALQAEAPDTPLDLENLAEEVESIGRELQLAVERQLRTVIEQALLIMHPLPGISHHAHEADMLRARFEIEDRLTPSLHPLVEARLPELYKRARRSVIFKLEEQNQGTEGVPESCPFTLGQLIDDNWFPVPSER